MKYKDFIAGCDEMRAHGLTPKRVVMSKPAFNMLRITAPLSCQLQHYQPIIGPKYYVVDGVEVEVFDPPKPKNPPLLDDLKLEGKFYIIHGRLDPNQDMNDWGFDGPTLERCTGLSCTYGNWELCFTNDEAREAARKLTGWTDGVTEYGLYLSFHDDMLTIFNAEKRRYEYFGDWGFT